MSYGKIYETTWWGNPVKDGWGSIYANLAGSIPSFALDFATIANDFTFTRSSFATRVNEFGLIETVTDLGSELVTNGSFDTDSDWSKIGNTTISGGKANAVANANGFFIVQTSTLDVNKTYKLTFDLTDYTSGTLQFVTSTGDISFSNDIGTKELIYKPVSANILFKCASAPATFSIDNVSVKEVLEDDVPRIDYSTGEAAFLLEPQSTNLIEYSEDFSLGWSLNNGTMTSNYDMSPDGSNNATLIQPTTNDCFLRERTNILEINKEYTASIYLKSNSGSDFDIIISLRSDDGSDDITKTVTVTTEWERYFVSITPSATQNFTFWVGRSATWRADEPMLLWGAQLEEKPYATSYIPTNGTAVTRSAETCVDATPTINSEEGVLYAEISALANDLTNRSLALSDGTASNRVNILFGTSTNSIRAIVLSGGASQFDQQYIVTSTLDTHKIALKYKENDFALWIDGVEVSTDNVGSVFAEGTLTELDFTVGVSSLPFYGNTKDLKIYDKALSDSELEELTTI